MNPKKVVIKVNILVLIASIGILAFLIIGSIFQFQSGLFQYLFPKPRSNASTIDNTPQVILSVSYLGITRLGVINAPVNQKGLRINWTTTGNPDSCQGYSWGISEAEATWQGTKDTSGGSFEVPILTKTNPYVFAITCQNKNGDASGDAVTINVGGGDYLNAPFLTDFYLTSNDKQFNTNTPFISTVGDKINLYWTVQNINTPYSICVSLGSLPKSYSSKINILGEDFLEIKEPKIYKYTIFCSNENNFIKKTATIFAN